MNITYQRSLKQFRESEIIYIKNNRSSKSKRISIECIYRERNEIQEGEIIFIAKGRQHSIMITNNLNVIERDLVIQNNVTMKFIQDNIKLIVKFNENKWRVGFFIYFVTNFRNSSEMNKLMIYEFKGSPIYHNKLFNPLNPDYLMEIDNSNVQEFLTYAENRSCNLTFKPEVVEKLDQIYLGLDLITLKINNAHNLLFLPPELFEHNKNLNYIDLSHNKLIFIPYYCNNKYICFLDISHNLIQDITLNRDDDIIETLYLDANSNQINCISKKFHGRDWHQYSYLNLNNNNLTEFNGKVGKIRLNQVSLLEIVIEVILKSYEHQKQILLSEFLINKFFSSIYTCNVCKKKTRFFYSINTREVSTSHLSMDEVDDDFVDGTLYSSALPCDIITYEGTCHKCVN